MRGEEPNINEVILPVLQGLCVYPKPDLSYCCPKTIKVKQNFEFSSFYHILLCIKKYNDIAATVHSLKILKRR